MVAFTLVLILAALLLSFATRATPHVRDRVVVALEERFKSDVEMESFQVSLFPRPEILGTGLVLRHQGRTDVPPLIKIGAYSSSAGLWGLMRTPMRLNTVELERLDITIPPRTRSSKGPASDAAAPGNSPPIVSRLSIDKVVTRAARLEVVPRNPHKMPWVWDIHNLVMRGLGNGDGATFEALLTNPKPRGEIELEGKFGPWATDDPEQTPLSGDYIFKSANLNTIKGIAGMLSSTGKFSGVLERIEVQGETRTPDFSIDIAGHAVPLTTRFQAVVDATNGDTWLEHVDAQLANTHLIARGAIVRAKEVKGRHIALNVTVDDGRIEDVLRLAVKGPKPMISGHMHLNTKFLLPAGEEDVVDKLELSGTFRFHEARFTNVKVQEQINTLSRRGKGITDKNGPNVVSRLSGRFTLKRGTLSFSELSFGVPGAVVQIAGTYDLKRELLDFRGNLLLDASLAETTTGWRAVLARVVQPLFRRPGGGSKLPIKIAGPADKPQFGLDVKRALGPG